ncbi:unnamed protein product [Lactuca virosa]|uniref:Bulb-type lectin domain-containing protein n=1 Tax=Lactuca virosa TaxID=75947 RepID=A0AAU9MEP1_9ASTR|nr:unnamed protein product [Lactuca virosa]
MNSSYLVARLNCQSNGLHNILVFNLAAFVEAIGGSGVDYTVRFCSSVRTFPKIRPGGRLRSTDRLVSPNVDFMADFYGERNGFLGIWRNNAEIMKVWIVDVFGLNIPTSGDHNLVVNTYIRDLIVTAGGKTLYNITDLQMGPHPNVTPTFTKYGYMLLINTNGTILWKTPFTTIIPPGKYL